MAKRLAGPAVALAPRVPIWDPSVSPAHGPCLCLRHVTGARGEGARAEVLGTFPLKEGGAWRAPRASGPSRPCANIHTVCAHCMGEGMGSPPPGSAQPACSLAVPSLHSWRNGLPGRHADHSHQPWTGQTAGEGRAGLLRPAVCPPDTVSSRALEKAGRCRASSGHLRHGPRPACLPALSASGFSLRVAEPILFPFAL